MSVAPTATSGTNGTPVQPIVQIEKLSHTFGAGDVSQQVLTEIDLRVKPGELVIVTGASGCGKTTMLTLIGALRSVQKGSVQVLGRELHGLGKAELIAVRRNIGRLSVWRERGRCDQALAGTGHEAQDVRDDVGLAVDAVGPQLVLNPVLAAAGCARQRILVGAQTCERYRSPRRHDIAFD